MAAKNEAKVSQTKSNYAKNNGTIMDAATSKGDGSTKAANTNSNYMGNYLGSEANGNGQIDGSGGVPFNDGGFSKKLTKKLNKYPNHSNKEPSDPNKFFVDDSLDGSVNASSGPQLSGLDALMHYAHFVKPGEKYEDRMYDSVFRFGAYNTTSQFANGKEFLFFTKPDLHIFRTNESGKITDVNPQLNPGLQNGFWQDVAASKTRIVAQLQSAYGHVYTNETFDPFCHLLSNQCTSNLDIPSLSATSVDTATNMYGVGFSYRGSSEESDDQVEFSLEFKDTKYLDIYYFFKCYEEYETEKHHGTVRPARPYIMNKIIHDQFAIYKFIVDEDMETLIYWGKLYGVMPMSLPRDTFSNDNFENGLSYSINFKAAFYEDMRPEILKEFNDLGQPFWDYFNPAKKKGYEIGIYNPWFGRTDGRWPRAAHIYRVSDDAIAKKSPNGYRLKLAWRGDTVV